MSSLASGIGFSLVGIMGHACVLEAAISRRAVSELHALGALGELRALTEWFEGDSAED